jgi:hypothetical protein
MGEIQANIKEKEEAMERRNATRKKNEEIRRESLKKMIANMRAARAAMDPPKVEENGAKDDGKEGNSAIMAIGNAETLKPRNFDERLADSCSTAEQHQMLKEYD